MGLSDYFVFYNMFLFKSENQLFLMFHLKDVKQGMDIPDYIVNKKDYWKEKNYRSRNVYIEKYDGTAVDRLIIELKAILGDKLWGIRVSGLNGEPTSPHNDSSVFFESFIVSQHRELTDKHKLYRITLELNPKLVQFHETHLSWVEGYFEGLLKEGTLDDYLYNNSKLFDWIKNVLIKQADAFRLSSFFGISGGQNPWRCYGHIFVNLKISGLDIFHHCGIDKLTDLAKNYPSEIAVEFDNIISKENISFPELYDNKKLRDVIARQAENVFRQKIGLKEVGGNNINESLLYYSLKKEFQSTIREWSPIWLENKRIDFYIPELNLAVEYHGQQHYAPVEYFGGNKKYKEQIERDNKVRYLCKQNGIFFFEWPYFIQITEIGVNNMLNNYVPTSNPTNNERENEGADKGNSTTNLEFDENDELLKLSLEILDECAFDLSSNFQDDMETASFVLETIIGNCKEHGLSNIEAKSFLLKIVELTQIPKQLVLDILKTYGN